MTRASTDVLIDRVPGARMATDAAWVIAFSLVTAACAQMIIHLPISPVPITGQPFAVLLSGAVLGWRRGFLSQVASLAEGAAGLPVFADGAGSALRWWPLPRLLLCFPWPRADRIFGGNGRRIRLEAGGSPDFRDVLILLAGSAWLRLLFRVPFAQAWVLGFYPFLVADVFKVALVGCVLPRVLRRFDVSHQSSVRNR